MANIRIDWIDYAKAFSIIFVVLLHAGIPYPLKGVIRVFLIPFFFFISGIFSNISRYPDFLTFLKQKGLRILIPYFSFNLITFLFWLFIGRNYGADANTPTNPLDAFWGIFIATATSLKHYVPLWFLACLFVVEVLYFIIFRNVYKKQYQFILLVAILLFSFVLYQFNIKGLPWSIDIAFTMIIFYGLGTLLKDVLLKAEIKSLKNLIALIGIAFISTLIVLLVYNTNDEAKVYVNIFGNYFLFLIGATAGIILMICLMKLLTIFFKPYKFILFIGKSTLIILSLHLISGSVVKAIAYFGIGLPLSVFELPAVTYFYGISSIAFLIPVIFFIEKYTPFILGKFKPQHVE